MKDRMRYLRLLALPVLFGLAAIIYQFPPINERLAWRLDSLRARIKYAVNPPQKEVFVPGDNPDQTGIPSPTAVPTATPHPTATTAPDTSPTPAPEATAAAPLSPTPSPTPLPTLAALTGIKHEYQKFNNCGPANLAMSLSYWGWEGDQNITAAYLKPNQRDKNVMPYKMVAYVNEETQYKALTRMGGTLDLMKRLIATGFPVIAETGFDNQLETEDFIGWMGHYEVVNAYDDAEGKFYLQDSYLGPRIGSTYQDMKSRWRAFNYTFIVTYPPEKEELLFEVLGSYQDPAYGMQQAAATASTEIYNLTEPRARFFAWFNRGSSLVALDDYNGAATAYDEAFRIYPQIPEEERPWRMMWYQTGPYWAYYYSGRYYDVINLATQTIEAASEPAIEESWFWRAMARNQLGNRSGAIADLRKALDLNDSYEIARRQLNELQNQ